MQQTQVRSLGWEDPLEEEIATHSCTLAWRPHGTWRATVPGVAMCRTGLRGWTTTAATPPPHAGEGAKRPQCFLRLNTPGTKGRFPLVIGSRRHKRHRFNPWVRKNPGGGNGNLLQYSPWRIPWTEEPGGLQSRGSQKVGHD